LRTSRKSCSRFPQRNQRLNAPVSHAIIFEMLSTALLTTLVESRPSICDGFSLASATALSKASTSNSKAQLVSRNVQTDSPILVT